MQTPPRHYRVSVSPNRFALACAACYDREPIPDATLATEAQGRELEPIDNCHLCGTPLLQAGIVHREFKARGFRFLSGANRSAWVSAEVVDNLVQICTVTCPDGHAPLDDDDGRVCVNRLNVHPLQQWFTTTGRKVDYFDCVTAALNVLTPGRG